MWGRQMFDNAAMLMEVFTVLVEKPLGLVV
jgi:hypothetical protein